MSTFEIEQMLGISLEESRVYQDAKVEGRVEGRVEEGRSLVIRQLNRKVGKLSKPLLTKVEALSLEPGDWTKRGERRQPANKLTAVKSMDTVNKH